MSKFYFLCYMLIIFIGCNNSTVSQQTIQKQSQPVTSTPIDTSVKNNTPQIRTQENPNTYIEAFEKVFRDSLYKELFNSEGNMMNLTEEDCVYYTDVETQEEVTNFCLYKYYKENKDGVVIGDLNQDGLKDALVKYTLEGFGGGSNYIVQYAYMKKNPNQTISYVTSIPCGSKTSDSIITITTILNNGLLKGYEMDHFGKKVSEEKMYKLQTIETGELELIEQ